MRKIFIKHIALYLVVFLSYISNILAQEGKSLDALLVSIKSNESPLNNGVYYKPQKNSSNGTAYFNDLNYFVAGSVTYDGHDFSNVPLMYDLVSDLIITSTDDGSYMYSLIYDKTLAFNINGHCFVNLVLSEKSSLKSGFFEVLYDKKLKVFLKRTKTFREVVDRTGVTSSYVTNVNYYLKKDEIYYEISGESSFLKLFKERKKEIKKFLRENEISFSENPTKAIIAMSSFSDSLSK